jgi:hypothetical protein
MVCNVNHFDTGAWRENNLLFSFFNQCRTWLYDSKWQKLISLWPSWVSWTNHPLHNAINALRSLTICPQKRKWYSFVVVLPKPQQVHELLQITLLCSMVYMFMFRNHARSRFRNKFRLIYHVLVKIGLGAKNRKNIFN